MHWKPLDFFPGDKNNKRKHLLEREHLEHALAASPVPYILMVVLIWVVTAVTLLCSDIYQRDLTSWNESKQAPFTLRARNDFTYTDSFQTEKLRNAARSRSTLFLSIDPAKSAGIRQAAEVFLASKAMDNLPLSNRAKFIEQLDSLLKQGIFSPEVFSGATTGKREIRLTSQEKGKNYYDPPPDTAKCIAELNEILKFNHGQGKTIDGELLALLEQGNLVNDSTAEAETTKAADTAANAVPPVLKHRKRGELLIEKDQLITRSHIDMLEAEKRALPAGYGLALLGSQLLISFILLLTALFFLYRTYPEIFRAPRRFGIAGFSMIISLLINFTAMRIFFHFFSSGILTNYELAVFIIPVPFGAALISILLGNRTAIFSGFVIAAVSALMLRPEMAFVLVIRWFAISALLSLCIRNVSNYRSFFIRVFFCGALFTLLVNCDLIYDFRHDPLLLKHLFFTLLGSSLFSAVASLMAVFVFEMVFNVDTSMSLMVLGDFNHPLLERLKREAPGTMFHCMTVATLAEDAARAIRANPSRAKVGALFHDIGKLLNPGNFVENNTDSPAEYEKLSPSECCSRICRHVTDGLTLARDYRLCSFIREAIVTHHGDDLISFFYQRALAQSKDSGKIPDEKDFRYAGEPPVGKELTIIALADACEAASRSLDKPTAESIEKLVNDIFAHRMRGGQLRNSMLTLEEFELIRKSFISNLTNLNHSRIAYTREKKK